MIERSPPKQRVAPIIYDYLINVFERCAMPSTKRIAAPILAAFMLAEAAVFAGCRIIKLSDICNGKTSLT